MTNFFRSLIILAVLLAASVSFAATAKIRSQLYFNPQTGEVVSVSPNGQLVTPIDPATMSIHHDASSAPIALNSGPLVSDLTLRGGSGNSSGHGGGHGGHGGDHGGWGGRHGGWDHGGGWHGGDDDGGGWFPIYPCFPDVYPFPDYCY